MKVHCVLYFAGDCEQFVFLKRAPYEGASHTFVFLVRPRRDDDLRMSGEVRQGEGLPPASAIAAGRPS